MGIARTVSVLGSLLSLLAAQQQEELEVLAAANVTTELFRVPELGRYDTDLPEGAQTAPKRLRSLLERANVTAGKPRVDEYSPGVWLLSMRLRIREISAVQGVFEQLQKEAPLQVRLECSLVTMPSSIAQAQDLLDGRTVAADAETVVNLMREATKNKGTLCNLPEVTAGPLAPFVIESPRKPDTKEAEVLRLRGEMLPLNDREVAILMHLVRGALPVDKTREPDLALLKPVFRLQAGKCALTTVFEGETATVLVVRCVDVAAKAPPAPIGR